MMVLNVTIILIKELPKEFEGQFECLGEKKT